MDAEAPETVITLSIEQFDALVNAVDNLRLRLEALEAFATRRPTEPISDQILDMAIAAREAEIQPTPSPEPEVDPEPAPVDEEAAE